MEFRGHKPVLRGTSYVCVNCGDFLLDVRTAARLRSLDVDPVKRAAVERRMLRDPKLAKRLVDEDPREVVATYKLADKFNDFLMNPQARPDLQKPEAQEFLQSLQNNGFVNDKTDELLPWLTREWKKGRVKLQRGPQYNNVLYDAGPEYAYDRANQHDPDESVEETYHRLSPDTFGHWADWYRSDHPSRKGVDIMQMKAPELHQTIKDWDTDMRQKAGEASQSRGDVVHSYPDGWTVQKLNSEKALNDEGDSMGHCVGGYWPEVQRGNTLIYSLRDHQNQPHATWEITPRRWKTQDGGTYTGTEPNGIPAFAEPMLEHGKMEQIQGKANEPPLPEYQKRIKDYFETAFPDEKDRPYWEDMDVEDLDDLDPQYLGYTPYHPGDYGLNEPNINIDWNKALHNDEYYGRDPERIVEYAAKQGELSHLSSEVDYELMGKREEAQENANGAWEREGRAGAEHDWSWNWEYYAPEYPQEPHISEYENQDEYDKAKEEFEEELSEYDQRLDDAKDTYFEEQESQYIEEYLQNDDSLWYLESVESELASAIHKQKQKEREKATTEKTGATASYHPRYITGEPCNCTFTKHLAEGAPNWYVSTTLVCEACGDPLEHGKCKRCDWGQWSNAMGEENPADQTKEVKPAIQASVGDERQDGPSPTETD